MVFEALPGGKIRLNAVAWVEPKMIMDDQALEVRFTNGQFIGCARSGFEVRRAIRSTRH